MGVFNQPTAHKRAYAIFDKLLVGLFTIALFVMLASVIYLMVTAPITADGKLNTTWFTYLPLRHPGLINHNIMDI